MKSVLRISDKIDLRIATVKGTTTGSNKRHRYENEADKPLFGMVHNISFLFRLKLLGEIAESVLKDNLSR